MDPLRPERSLHSCLDTCNYQEYLDSLSPMVGHNPVATHSSQDTLESAGSFLSTPMSFVPHGCLASWTLEVEVPWMSLPRVVAAASTLGCLGFIANIKS